MHGQNINWPVCVCVSTRQQVRPLNGFFFKVDSLKDADLRKDVFFGVSMMNNHI